jgi:hypothetical protein
MAFPFLSDVEEVEFQIQHEGWNIYELSDRTILRIRPIILKFFKLKGVTAPAAPMGLGISAQNVMTVKAKPELKGVPSRTPIDPVHLETEVEKVEVQAKPFSEEWNQYTLSDGTPVRVKLVLISVFRTKHYDQLGEPVYVVKSDNILAVDRKPK